MTGVGISVAMPAYNAAKWIGEALDSVLGQTVAPDEVVVVDDGSTDDTAAIAAGLGDRVRVVSQPNGGAPAAYNRAFAECRCEYVAMCSADDLWEPRKLERQRAALAAHPEVDIVFGGARTFGLTRHDYVRPSTQGVLAGDAFTRELFALCVIAAPSVVLRRSLHGELGGFREDLSGEDYEFWMRAVTNGAVFFFDPALMVHLRVHGGNLSGQALSMWEMNHQVHTAYAHSVPDDLARRTLANDLRTIGRCRLGLDQLEAGRDAYAASLRREPHPIAVAALAALSLPGAELVLARRNHKHRI